MDEIEKNEILKKVSSVLHFCQDIVSRLSSSSSPPPNADNNYNLDKSSSTEHCNDQDANKELIIIIADYRDEKQEHYDIIDGENDLWWDASQPSSQFYTLVFDNDDVSVYTLDTNYADFLLPSDMLENTPLDMPRDVMLPADK